MLADRGDERMILAMPGLEPDNLLALLALMGLLRSLESSRPEWNSHAFWNGPPWVARLSVTAGIDGAQVASAANQGVRLIAASFDDDKRRNVDFGIDDYRAYAKRARREPIAGALASALTSESKPSKDRLQASPLVMMFGQGHPCFLERLMAITGDTHISDEKMFEALFHPWRREDDVDGFRWDPEEDQRYAFRYGNPSKAGAALGMIGTNRLAAIGFLSFPTVPRDQQRLAAAGAVYDHSWNFVWPIWTVPISRACIEAFLNHPQVLEGRLSKVRPLGIAEIMRAQRVANGKYINVTRARPMES